MYKDVWLQDAGIDGNRKGNSGSTADESLLGIRAVMWTGLAKV